MSRTEARIHVSCWEDSDFLALSLNAQHAFFLLISQPNITFAGHITLNIRGWASMAGVGAVRFRRTLAELEAKRFVVIDETTGELWVRTFVKYDGVLSGPNLIVAMTRDYAHIRSRLIRDALITQLGEGFREGLPERLWERLAEPFKQGFEEALSRVCAPAHAEPPSPSPSPPPPPPPSRSSTATSEPDSASDVPSADASGRRRRREQKLNSNGNGNGGGMPAGRPSSELVDGAVRLIARRRLVDALGAAAAGRREPIRSPRAWLIAAENDLRDTAVDEIVGIWSELGEPDDPVGVADSWTCRNAQPEAGPVGPSGPEFVERCPTCGLLSFDCRCHG